MRFPPAGMRRLAVGALFGIHASGSLFALIVLGGHALASFPGVRVVVKQDGLPPVLALKVGRSEDPPLVQSIVVAEVEGEIVCKVIAERRPIAVGEWKYGEPIKGCKVDCRPLRAGSYSLGIDAENARDVVRLVVTTKGKVSIIP